MPHLLESDREIVVAELQKAYGGRSRFTVGYSGYAPFVTRNGGEPHVVLDEILREVASVINCELVYEPTTWDEFPQLFGAATIDTMAEPIILTRRRSTYSVMPYMKMTTSVLVVREAEGAFIESKATEVRALTDRRIRSLIPRDDYYEAVYDALMVIAGHSATKKIGVTRGVLEEDILDEVGIPYVTSSADDIEKNIVEAVKAGVYFFADKLSAVGATRTLEREPLRTRVRARIIHLFSERPPLMAECGFGVGRGNRALQKYFAHLCTFEMPRIQTILREGCPAGTFNGEFFRLLESTEQRSSLITRYSHEDLLFAPPRVLMPVQESVRVLPGAPVERLALPAAPDAEAFAGAGMQEQIVEAAPFNGFIELLNQGPFEECKRFANLVLERRDEITADERDQLRRLAPGIGDVAKRAVALQVLAALRDDDSCGTFVEEIRRAAEGEDGPGLAATVALTHVRLLNVSERVAMDIIGLLERIVAKALGSESTERQAVLAGSIATLASLGRVESCARIFSALVDDHDLEIVEGAIYGMSQLLDRTPPDSPNAEYKETWARLLEGRVASILPMIEHESAEITPALRVLTESFRLLARLGRSRVERYLPDAFRRCVASEDNYVLAVIADIMNGFPRPEYAETLEEMAHATGIPVSEVSGILHQGV